MRHLKISVAMGAAIVGVLTERALNQEEAHACSCDPPLVLVQPCEVEGSAQVRERWLGRPLEVQVGILGMRLQDEQFNHADYIRVRPEGEGIQ